MPVTWSDEKLILLYCPGRGSNSRPSAHRGFKHGQGVPRPYSLGRGGRVSKGVAVYVYRYYKRKLKWVGHMNKAIFGGSTMEGRQERESAKTMEK